MADNYLENKMEEHRRGGAAPYRRHFTPTGNKPGTAVFGTEVNTVLLEGHQRLGEDLEAVARRFKSTGARVAFICSDKAYGTHFAQENSLVFIPASARSVRHSALQGIGRFCNRLEGVCARMRVHRRNCTR